MRFVELVCGIVLRGEIEGNWNWNWKSIDFVEMMSWSVGFVVLLDCWIVFVNAGVGETWVFLVRSVGIGMVRCGK